MDKISYRFNQPRRGDIIGFPNPRDPSEMFMKRIIALPNETIQIQHGVVIVKNKAYPDGFIPPVSLYRNTYKRGGPTTTTLRENEYFVMGDNRENSMDSRSFGPISRDAIYGRAVLRFAFSLLTDK